ncbi:pollen-specific leucine-rich repeat extensin-like protein 3 [Iris pallida]|uniref:Pollen-specific leucine-rich repeat extensin-like protein 3 n=1 Tax=Iris pallida TaxID=29817 RepID=A0AAX6FGP5_IRIPA|nr:pollen-specific leucine-rich repeat extensin-like protein 3 [Iris pallida]
MRERELRRRAVEARRRRRLGVAHGGGGEERLATSGSPPAMATREGGGVAPVTERRAGPGEGVAASGVGNEGGSCLGRGRRCWSAVVRRLAEARRSLGRGGSGTARLGRKTSTRYGSTTDRDDAGQAKVQNGGVGCRLAGDRVPTVGGRTGEAHRRSRDERSTDRLPDRLVRRSTPGVVAARDIDGGGLQVGRSSSVREDMEEVSGDVDMDGGTVLVG